MLTQSIGLLEERVGRLAKFSYRATGSGVGRAEISSTSDGVVDFAASDVPLSHSAWSQIQAQNSPVLQLPILLGALTFAYNIPGLTDNLNVTGCLAIDIFQRTVKLWNDPRVLIYNPALRTLVQERPDNDWRIVVIYRLGTSGSTSNVISYLTKVSATRCAGALTIVDPVSGNITWPSETVGLSEEDQVAAMILDTPMSFGYVSLGFGNSLNMNLATIDNRDGYMISPHSPDFNITNAVANIQQLFPADASQDWSGVSVDFLPGADVWPMIFTTYLMLRPNSTRLQGTNTGSMIRALADLLYSAEGTGIVEQFLSIGMPPQVLDYCLSAVTTHVQAPDFLEEDTPQPVVAASSDLVISKRRQSGAGLAIVLLERELADQSAAIAALQQQLLTSQAALSADFTRRLDSKAAKSAADSSPFGTPALILAVIAVAFHIVTFSMNTWFNLRALRVHRVVDDSAPPVTIYKAGGDRDEGPGYLVQAQ